MDESVMGLNRSKMPPSPSNDTENASRTLPRGRGQKHTLADIPSAVNCARLAVF